MYIICLWRISESLGFIWSIPPICSCTDYNISKSNNILYIYIYMECHYIVTSEYPVAITYIYEEYRGTDVWIPQM